MLRDIAWSQIFAWLISDVRYYNSNGNPQFTSQVAPALVGEASQGSIEARHSKLWRISIHKE